MITKAIIDSRVDDYTYKVRIPILNKPENVEGATPRSQLYNAHVCTLQNIAPFFAIGEVVYVEFEDNDPSQPIIVGSLLNGKPVNGFTDAKLGSLIVNNSIEFSDGSGTLNGEVYRNLTTLYEDASVANLNNTKRIIDITKLINYLDSQSVITGKILAPGSSSSPTFTYERVDTSTSKDVDDRIRIISSITGNYTIIQNPQHSEFFPIDMNYEYSFASGDIYYEYNTAGDFIDLTFDYHVYLKEDKGDYGAIVKAIRTNGSSDHQNNSNIFEWYYELYGLDIKIPNTLTINFASGYKTLILDQSPISVIPSSKISQTGKIMCWYPKFTSNQNTEYNIINFTDNIDKSITDVIVSTDLDNNNYIHFPLKFKIAGMPNPAVNEKIGYSSLLYYSAGTPEVPDPGTTIYYENHSPTGYYFGAWDWSMRTWVKQYQNSTAMTPTFSIRGAGGDGPEDTTRIYSFSGNITFSVRLPIIGITTN